MIREWAECVMNDEIWVQGEKHGYGAGGVL